MKNKKAYFVGLAVVVILLIVAAVTNDGSGFAGTAWSLFPPVVAIGLALISKEVYSSLFLGCLVGAMLVCNFAPWDTVVMLVGTDAGIICNLADSWNAGILVFLVILGIMVAMMNKTGGSAAFGRWAKKSVKTRAGAQLVTMALGVIIFIDDYFNCLTVGSVMRPVTEGHNISRAKLAYVIDATAAPVCMIAPVSSWAAAVSGYVEAEGVNGLGLFIAQIPYNYYCLLTLLMVVFLAVTNLDFGPMLTHEYNAQVHNDLFTTAERPFAGADDYEEGEKNGSVLDLLIPIIILIVLCVIGMIWTGGFFDGETFMDAFSNSDASLGLAVGSMIALVLSFLYYWVRGLIGFEKSMSCIPEGFIQMVSPILILTFAWTLGGLTKGEATLNSGAFVSAVMENAGTLQLFLPAILFIFSCFIAFATGTSWGTIGIMAPIAVTVFDYTVDPTLCVIGLAACCAGGVCGDHSSPISDTTIMASAGAHCYHLNHVSTQIPYALTVAIVSFVCFIIAAFVRNAAISLIIAIALMLAVLFVIRAISVKKNASMIAEMKAAAKK